MVLHSPHAAMPTRFRRETPALAPVKQRLAAARPAAGAMSCTPLEQGSAPLSDEDWFMLFGAVNERLRGLLRRRRSAADPAASPMLDGGVGAEALQDCLQALEQLQRGGQRLLWAARADIERTRAGEQQAWHQAFHDPLTLLPNRAGFMDRLAQVMARREAADPGPALLYLDLDGFKRINDLHGHEVGDRLLAVVALRLRRAVRTGDMVGRLGGDEFACLVSPGLSLDPLNRLAGKLLAAVSAPVTLGSLRLSVRPSIGIARCPADGASAALLLRHADQAMYHAKRSGCGTAVHDGMRDDPKAK